MITDTDDRLIAAAANIGFSRSPMNGNSTPAAIGTPSAPQSVGSPYRSKSPSSMSSQQLSTQEDLVFSPTRGGSSIGSTHVQLLVVGKGVVRERERPAQHLSTPHEFAKTRVEEVEGGGERCGGGPGIGCRHTGTRSSNSRR